VRILLLQLKRIGDLILTTPTIIALRANLSDLRLDLAVDEGSAEMLPLLSGIDRSFVARRGLDFGTWFEIAQGRYDWCLDFTRSDRSAWLASICFANERITYEHTRRRSIWRPLFYTRFVDSSVRAKHTVDHYLSFLEPLGLIPSSTQPRLIIPAEAHEKVGRLLNETGLREQVIVMHAGSARSEKFWQTERWAELIQHCLRNYPHLLVLTGGRGATEQAHLAAIKASTSDPRLLDLSGRLTLPQFAALVARAALLIGIDSASAHFADALGRPQVVLFGMTNPYHWRPRHSPAIVVQAGHENPPREFSPETPGAPMSRISTQQVIDAMEALLPVSPASA
jgi:predicted lipopolysaccharide heptosyltransferase III